MLPELIGRAVCASDPTHGLPGLGHALPLCARCAGLHLAVVIGWIAWRPRGIAPRAGAALQPHQPLQPLLAAGALLAPMAIDVGGISAGLWHGDGWIRTGTGLLGGLGVALALRVADGLASSGGGAVNLPRATLPALAAGVAATAAALAVVWLAPRDVGAAVTAAAVVASASLALLVALRALVGGAHPARPALRVAAVGLALALLVLLGRAR